MDLDAALLSLVSFLDLNILPAKFLVKFTDQEIKVARQLKAAGVPWVPSVGHYVFDSTQLVQPPSPFQTGVYFVLHYDYFMTLAGGVDAFVEKMVWLPTWEQTRFVASEVGVSESDFQSLRNDDSIWNRGGERLAMYELLLNHLLG